MKRTKGERDLRLASRWFAPGTVPGTEGGAGEPLLCIATTYTFDARIFEQDLLPRFLGLKFDDVEGGRAFVIERESKLATSRAVVLVDEAHVDGSQTTLRWDQLPVRVARGVQHSKIVLLMWERCIRVMISSANLTKFGYRRNHEIAGALDFFNHASSPPRRIILDSVMFLETLISAGWVIAAAPVLQRLVHDLSNVRATVRRWTKIPADYSPRETPRVTFAVTLPRHSRKQQITSPLNALAEAWGSRRATDITVMTPFVGCGDEDVDPVVDRLLKIPTFPDATGSLVVPGRLAESQARKVMLQLPRRFRDAWAKAWIVPPSSIPVYVVPSCRKGKKVKGLRSLHAKAVAISDGQRVALLCGSSNFSPRGMGIRVANIEANWCYVGPESPMWRAFPVEWEDGPDSGPFDWPEEPAPKDEEPIPSPGVPACFLWATYNQKKMRLTIGLNLTEPFPTEWNIRVPTQSTASVLISGSTYGNYLVGTELVIPLEGPLTATCLIVDWVDTDGRHEAKLATNVTRPEDLLPPEELASLSLAAIIDCLLSGRDPAEWIQHEDKRIQAGSGAAGNLAAVESLRAVDTEGFLLYRVRRLGQALSVLAERLLRSIRSVEAIRYRVLLDPLGPQGLAKAVHRQWSVGELSGVQKTQAATVTLFSLTEVALTMAHVAARLAKDRNGGPDLKPVFRELVANLDGLIVGVELEADKDVRRYSALVRLQCNQLVATEQGKVPHAG